MHLASFTPLAGPPLLYTSFHDKHTDDSIFELALALNIKQLSSSQSEDHALIIFLQVVVDL